MPDSSLSATGAGDQVTGGGRCDSCGRGDPPLVAVHRVYLELDRLGAVVGHRRQASVERWCAACRATYPHEPVEPPADGPV